MTSWIGWALSEVAQLGIFAAAGAALMAGMLRLR